MRNYIAGHLECVNNYVELFAAAYYIDVCIFLYRKKEDDWILFHKDWPKYDKLDLNNEKCIYLYEKKNNLDIVSYVS